FTPWLTATTTTSATYAGTSGHSYAFFSVATDIAGNRQPTPAAAQATTVALSGTPAIAFAIFVPSTGVLSINELFGSTSGLGANLTISGNTVPGGGATSLITVTGGLGTTVNGVSAVTFTTAFPGAIAAINVSLLNDSSALTVGTPTGVINLPST